MHTRSITLLRQAYFVWQRLGGDRYYIYARRQVDLTKCVLDVLRCLFSPTTKKTKKQAPKESRPTGKLQGRKNTFFL